MAAGPGRLPFHPANRPECGVRGRQEGERQRPWRIIRNVFHGAILHGRRLPLLPKGSPREAGLELRFREYGQRPDPIHQWLPVARIIATIADLIAAGSRRQVSTKVAKSASTGLHVRQVRPNLAPLGSELPVFPWFRRVFGSCPLRLTKGR